MDLLFTNPRLKPGVIDMKPSSRALAQAVWTIINNMFN